MDKKILFVLAIPKQAKKFWGSEEFKQKIDAISQYDLENLDLSKYSGIIFSLYVDQYLLLSLKDKLTNFLNNGNKIVFNGHIFKAFLKDLNSFIPIQNPSLNDFSITKLKDHPIYHNIDMDKLSKRKGVAGFFSRGTNPPLKNSQYIMAIKNGACIVDWEAKFNDGILYVHSGNDLWTCMEDFEDNKIMFKNIISWIRGEDNE